MEEEIIIEGNIINYLHREKSYELIKATIDTVVKKYVGLYKWKDDNTMVLRHNRVDGIIIFSDKNLNIVGRKINKLYKECRAKCMEAMIDG